MKKIFQYRRAAWLAARLALSATFITLFPSSANATGEATKESPGFIEKMDQWQEKMSEKFRDTWKSLRDDDKEKSVATASVDLREDKDHYTLRLNLPGRDLEKVSIRLDGDILQILAPAEDKAGRYEQTVALTGVAPGATPKIERKAKDNMIVVSITKNPASANAKSATALPPSTLFPLSDWDRDIFARMDQMSREMDRTFEEAFREFRSVPDHQGFFDEPRFGSNLDLKEEGDNYVLRAYLPDRDMQNINVTVEDRTLKIEAREQETSNKEDKSGALHSIRKAAYSQLITLPGPVQSEKMKVEKKDGMVVVTIPKKK